MFHVRPLPSPSLTSALPLGDVAFRRETLANASQPTHTPASHAWNAALAKGGQGFEEGVGQGPDQGVWRPLPQV